jgi:hypothetical protein
MERFAEDSRAASTAAGVEQMAQVPLLVRVAPVLVTASPLPSVSESMSSLVLRELDLRAFQVATTRPPMHPCVDRRWDDVLRLRLVLARGPTCISRRQSYPFVGSVRSGAVRPGYLFAVRGLRHGPRIQGFLRDPEWNGAVGRKVNGTTRKPGRVCGPTF